MHIDFRELTPAEINEEYEIESAKWITNSDGIKLTEKQGRLRLTVSLML